MKNPKFSKRRHRKFPPAPPLGSVVLDLIRQAIDSRCERAKSINDYRQLLEGVLEDSDLWDGLENLRLAMKQLKRDYF